MSAVFFEDCRTDKQSSVKKRELEHTECCGRASQLKCACEHCAHLRNAEKRVLCGVPCIESCQQVRQLPLVTSKKAKQFSSKRKHM